MSDINARFTDCREASEEFQKERFLAMCVKFLDSMQGPMTVVTLTDEIMIAGRAEMVRPIARLLAAAKGFDPTLVPGDES